MGGEADIRSAWAGFFFFPRVQKVCQGVVHMLRCIPRARFGVPAHPAACHRFRASPFSARLARNKSTFPTASNQIGLGGPPVRWRTFCPSAVRSEPLCCVSRLSRREPCGARAAVRSWRLLFPSDPSFRHVPFDCSSSSLAAARSLAGQL